jgi:hypothetical protein
MSHLPDPASAGVKRERFPRAPSPPKMRLLRNCCRQFMWRHTAEGRPDCTHYVAVVGSLHDTYQRIRRGILKTIEPIMDENVAVKCFEAPTRGAAMNVLNNLFNEVRNNPRNPSADSDSAVLYEYCSLTYGVRVNPHEFYTGPRVRREVMYAVAFTDSDYDSRVRAHVGIPWHTPWGVTVLDAPTKSHELRFRSTFFGVQVIPDFIPEGLRARKQFLERTLPRE